jgi:hypothetical protein
MCFVVHLGPPLLSVGLADFIEVSFDSEYALLVFSFETSDSRHVPPILTTIPEKVKEGSRKFFLELAFLV